MKLKTKCNSMGNALNSAARKYRTTEAELINGNFISKTILKNISIGITGIRYTKEIRTLPGAKIEKSVWVLKSFFSNDFSKDIQEAIWGKDDNKDKIKKKEITYYQKNKDLDVYKQDKAIISGGVEKNKSVSLWNGAYSTEGKAGKFNISAKVAEAEAHSAFAAGIYSYKKGKDGKEEKVFAPGVNAEVGASVTAFQAKTDGRLGLGKNHDMLGVYGNGQITAGKIGANAKGTLALRNSKGEVSPTANAEFEVEAIAAEAKGSAGVSVLGVDAGVTGSVNVGIGAHAKFAMEDYKIKVDVGASLGIGVSGAAEIDISGAVNAIQGATQSVYNHYLSWISKGGGGGGR